MDTNIPSSKLGTAISLAVESPVPGLPGRFKTRLLRNSPECRVREKVWRVLNVKLPLGLSGSETSIRFFL